MWTTIPGAILGFVAFFYLTSGTFAYWEGWIYLTILIIPMLFIMIYFLKHDPKVIERRMRLKEKELTQKK